MNAWTPIERRQIVSAKTVVIVGGGFSGATFGLKLHLRCPDWRIVIVERHKRLGRGVAYGSCGPAHLLNVPVHRMEIGLTPSFADWLRLRQSSIAEALVESTLDLNAAFVPRRLFGEYLQERLGAALNSRSLVGLSRLRGEVVRLLTDRPGVLLTDGRQIKADMVVLAMGNLPPSPPGGPDSWLYDSGFFVPDPWAIDAFSDVDPAEPLLLIGSGLTTVDIALRLQQQGHRGALLAVSRRGLTPRTHAAGGTWPDFLQGRIPASPLSLMRMVREQVDLATQQNIPWQRVFDAARPAVPSIWNEWSQFSRRQFLRHLRPRWDIHRHRMAPRVSHAFAQLQSSGALDVWAGRIAGYRPAGQFVEITVTARGGTNRTFKAGHIVNCTGPGGDFSKIAIPLIADLRDRKLAVPDPIGVGLETRDCAVINGAGNASGWLFALGPLTRPAWWEITAVPEINLQIDRLVHQLSHPVGAHPLTVTDFMDMGGGI